jgi:hypothetical protein
MSSSKTIRLSAHARLRLPQRGATEAEVVRAIREAPWQPMPDGKLEARLEMDGALEWNGRPYRSKVVRPVFVETEGELVVVTVFVCVQPPPRA